MSNPILNHPDITSPELEALSIRDRFSAPEPYKSNFLKGASIRKPDGQIGYLFDESRATRLATNVASSETIQLNVTRGEIFLTSACNMSCRYCLSRKHSMPEWDRENLRALIKTLAKRGTRHLQWTGGEVTVHPDLETYISWSKAVGMDNSISTNGTAEVEAYMGLVEAGVSHFSISLDNYDPKIFDQITRTKGRLPQVAETIKQLCKKNVDNAYKVVVNSVLTRESIENFMQDNAAQLRKYLEWCVRVGADDFKFLPASTERFADLFANREMMNKFINVCFDVVAEQYRFFFYRLAMLERGGHGLNSSRIQTCYHCLDDRAYDSLGAWPCIIHLREGGKRLYHHKDPTQLKQKRLYAFLHSDRAEDPICRIFCFDVYRALNERVASLLHAGCVEGA